MAVNQLSDARTDGTTLGQSVTDLISFYGKTPIVQRSGADQAAITVGTNTTAANTLLIEIRAALVAIGVIKGGA